MMSIGTRTHYLSADIHRILNRKETYLGILGVTMVLFFSVERIDNIAESVLYTFLFSTYGAGFVLSFLFCALPYGTVYSEELEHHYVKYLISRGNLKKYVISKTVTTFVSSVFVMGAGCVLFALLCSVKLPWTDAETFAELKGSIGYLPLISQKMYLLWFGVYGIQWGVFAGCLSLAAEYFSLYISNRLFILSVPVLLYQVITELGANTFRKDQRFDPLIVFDARYNLFGNDLKRVLWVLGTGVVFSVLIGTASYFRIKKRM